MPSDVTNLAASSTDTEIVPARTDMRIRVRSLVVVAGDTPSTIFFESGANTAITPTFDWGNNGGIVLNDNPRGWFETTKGAALTATTGAGSSTAILLGYDYLP